MSTILVSLRHFAHEHDDQPAFHATYLTLIFLAALLFNLGAFGLLILAHMSLDLVKYRERHGFSWAKTFVAMLRESLTDITLFILGVALSVYIHHSIAIAGVSALFRIPQGLLDPLILVIPKFEILHHVLSVLMRLRHYMRQLVPGILLRWSGTERICFALSLASLTFLAVSAPILHITWNAVFSTLRSELIPWKM